jgi:hypothetical protein
MCRLRFYDLITKKQTDCPLIPPLKNRKPDDIEYVQNVFNPAFASSVNYCPENKIFISAMTGIERIDFYDKYGKHITEILNPENKTKLKYPEDVISKKKSTNGYIRVGKRYFQSVHTFNKFFTVLYFGTDIEAAIRDASISSQLRFYNYKGDLKLVLKFDKNISDYAIDEKYGKLFTVCTLDDTNYVYDIKKFLNEL